MQSSRWPDFIAVPAVIVAVYMVTIIVLEVRWRLIHSAERVAARDRWGM
jgi:hypothetical protein